MHELGIATGVLDSVIEVAKNSKCLSVKQISYTLIHQYPSNKVDVTDIVSNLFWGIDF